jgi:hypothetical protein
MRISHSELTPKVREVFEVLVESGEARGRKTAMLALLLWNTMGQIIQQQEVL